MPSFLTRRWRRALSLPLAVLSVCAALWAGQAAAQAAEAEPILRGVVLLPAYDQLRPDGVPVPPGEVDATRVPTLAGSAPQAQIRKFIGQPLDDLTLDTLRAMIGRYYADIDQPFVMVVVPQQDATSGAVQVVVLEAILGQVAVENARHFDVEQYRKAFRLAAGQPINSTTLQADIDWINRNPYRNVTAMAAGGAEPRTTDITLRVTERRPFSASIAADNTGNRATGRYRLHAGVEWGDAFGRGDILSYRYTTSDEPELLKQHTASYTAFLPWRDVLTVSGVVADSKSEEPGSLVTAGGLTRIAALNYQHALTPRRGMTHSVSLGYDFKRTNNDILFGGQSVFNSTSEINQVSLTYSANRPDPKGSTFLTLQVVASPGGLTDRNTDEAFQQQQAGASADYVYAVATVERLTQVTPKVAWYARASLQRASETLLPSEQASFGGPGSNRAFAISAATRDNGLQIVNELRLGALKPGLPAALGLEGVGDQLTPLVFVDYGVGWNNDKPGGLARDRVQLGSVGAGFEYQVSTHGSVRFTYGAPVIHSGRIGPTLRPQFSVALKF